MIRYLWNGTRLFLHPDSPAAVYRHPRRFFENVLARVLNLQLKLLAPIWGDHKVKCGICGRQGRRFGYDAAISVRDFRADEICLWCRANRRTRVLVDLFSRYVDLTEGSLTIADIGAAPCTRTFFARHRNLHYIVVDGYKTAEVASDVTNICLPTNSVDGILCCHVLEHVDNYQQGMGELLRILKSGGRGIIAVPQTPGLDTSRRTGERSFRGYGHVWEFGDDFVEQLQNTGFRVTTVDVPERESSQQGRTMPFHVVDKP